MKIGWFTKVRTSEMKTGLTDEIKSGEDKFSQDIKGRQDKLTQEVKEEF